MSTRIVLADDHRLVREGLRELIDRQPDMKVVAEAEDGRTAVRLAKELSPDVVLMAITMPDMNGIEATRRMTAEAPVVKVIGVSMHSDRRFVTEMLRAGASGYLLKDRASEELAGAVRTVIAGGTYVSPGIAGVAAEDYAGRPTDEGKRSRAAEEPSAYSALTPREREVLASLARGRTAEQIASRLHARVETVETHLKQIMRKVGVGSTAELTAYAEREGLPGLM